MAQNDSSPAHASIHIDGSITQPVSPELYGIFFEDINYGGEGGIYGELIRNRFFEEAIPPPRCTVPQPGHICSPGGWVSQFPTGEPLPGWRTIGPRATIAPDPRMRLNAVREQSMQVTLSRGDTPAGVAALGYGGIAVKAGARYRLTVWAKGTETFAKSLTATLVESDRVVAAGALPSLRQGEWTRHELVLIASADAPRAELQLTASSAGEFWLGGVSLFPLETWKGRRNGLRPDLMDMLAALNPKFIRFPGGCVVEGFSRETGIRWKDTIGPIEERRGHWSLWGYRDTGGLGFHEFLLMCEDLGAEAMWIFNAGMSCQGRGPELVPLDELQPLIQDALDGIEYAIGPVDSPWGARRAAAGHPEPFPLKYVGIGNENWGPDYEARYKLFHAAIKARHSELLTIASAAVSSAPVEILDDHFYPDPDYFIAHHDHYDRAPRGGSKIFVGEFASIVNCGQGNLRAAIGEAAFLVGLERNPDLVRMTSYAPFFKNVFHPNPWNPDAIVFDTHRTFGTPSYHVLELFGRSRGDRLLATKVESPERLPTGRGGIGFGTSRSQAEFRTIRVTHGDRVLHDRADANDYERRTPDWAATDEGWRTTSVGDTLAVLSRRDWESYTLSLEACITDGPGSLRLRVLDNGRENAERDYIEIILGGANNDTYRIDRYIGWTQESLADARPGRLAPGTWHRIEVDVAGASITVRMDGAIVLEGRRRPLPDIVAVATVEERTGDLLLKIVNTAEAPRTIRVDISGLPPRASQGSVETITGPSLDSENSFATPRAVASVSVPELAFGNTFERVVPAHAVQVLRVPARR